MIAAEADRLHIEGMTITDSRSRLTAASGRRGSIFTRVRLPDGKVRVSMDQEVYERALAAAGAVLSRSTTAGRR